MRKHLTVALLLFAGPAALAEGPAGSKKATTEAPAKTAAAPPAAVAAPPLADGTTTNHAAFPLPRPEGKPIAISPGQRVFRLPMRYARVERFYRDQFAADRSITITEDRSEHQKVLNVISKRSDSAWSRVTVREGAVDTVVELTPMMRLGGEVIVGRGLPLVQVVIPLNPGVAEQAKAIDHMEDLRR